MTLDAAERTRLAGLDARLVRLSKDVKVLSHIAWPLGTRRRFLEGWHAGNPRLPEPEYAPFDAGERLRELEALTTGLDDGHPLEAFLKATAESYADLCRLLEATGTPRFGERSIAIYGRPDDRLPGGDATNLEAARHFVEVSRSYAGQFSPHEGDYCIPAHVVRDELVRRIDDSIPGGRVSVVLDARLTAKAAAGATRVRLRDETCFSSYDIEQLLQHEVFVHSLTALNGRDQPLLKSLGLGAARTTAAQEGLATFAELVTGAIDIGRLDRLAQRVVLTDMALSGADFLEVFRALLESGQTEDESWFSAMRVFRGAPLTGGTAFTKDTVYLRGLLEVHTFFRWALRHDHLEVARAFLSGRMTLNDALTLRPFFASGDLAVARYTPPWMKRGNGLAGYLAFSLFANAIRLERVGPDFTHR